MRYKVMWEDCNGERHESIVEAANEKEAERIIDEEEDPWGFLGTIKM